MRTTTIGAFPKPESIPLTDWFSKPDGDYTSSYLDELDRTDDAALDAAVHDVVRAQVEAGIDIPTDGEVRRENYIHYQCRHLGGIDFDRFSIDLAYRIMDIDYSRGSGEDRVVVDAMMHGPQLSFGLHF